MADQPKKTKGKPVKAKKRPATAMADRKTMLTYLVPVLILTLSFISSLLCGMGLLYWDDSLYVTGNPLLIRLSFAGFISTFSTLRLFPLSSYHDSITGS
jgi:hypothetical protein